MLIIVNKIKNSALPNSVITIKNIFNTIFLLVTKKLYKILSILKISFLKTYLAINKNIESNINTIKIL